MIKKTILATVLASVAFAGLSASALAETIEVKMLNKATEGNERYVFEPAVVVAQPGDVIKFVSTDKGHNSASHEETLPEGAENWKSKINEDFEVTVNAPGAYAYNCTPHYALGMVGVIYVPGEGAEASLEKVKAEKFRGKADARMKDYLAELDEKIAAM